MIIDFLSFLIGSIFFILLLILAFILKIDLNNDNTPKIMKGGLDAKTNANFEKTLFSRDDFANLTDKAETVVFFDDIKNKIKYEQIDRLKRGLHVGQVKLFLSELEFLTEYNVKNEKCLYVYAGSAPSNKMPFLSNLFPNAHFLLVDPNEHYLMFPMLDQYAEHNAKDLYYFKAARSKQRCPGADMSARSPIKPLDRYLNLGGKKCLRSNQMQVADTYKNLGEVISKLEHKFYIIEDYFTDELAEKIKAMGFKNLFFISDIRAPNPDNIEILWNSAMQYNWIKILRPICSMLKYRCPFTYDPVVPKNYMLEDFKRASLNGIDFLKNNKEKRFVYFDGPIWIQAFAPPTSTESRLLVKLEDIDKVKDYDLLNYEDRFFFFNLVHRPFGWHDIPQDFLDTSYGIDRCGDCALAYHIFNRYCEKFGDINYKTPKELFIGLLRDIKRTLRKDGEPHGYYYLKYNSKPSDLDSFAENVSLSAFGLSTFSSKDLSYTFTKEKASNFYQNVLAMSKKSTYDKPYVIPMIYYIKMLFPKNSQSYGKYMESLPQNLKNEVAIFDQEHKMMDFTKAENIKKFLADIKIKPDLVELAMTFRVLDWENKTISGGYTDFLIVDERIYNKFLDKKVCQFVFSSAVPKFRNYDIIPMIKHINELKDGMLFAKYDVILVHLDQLPDVYSFLIQTIFLNNWDKYIVVFKKEQSRTYDEKYYSTILVSSLESDDAIESEFLIYDNKYEPLF